MPTKKLSAYTINRIAKIKAEQALNKPKKRRFRRVKKECVVCERRKYLIEFNKTREWRENTCKKCRLEQRKALYRKKTVIEKIASMRW